MTNLPSGWQCSQYPVLGPGVCAVHSERASPDAYWHRVDASIGILYMHQEGSRCWSCVEDLVQAVVKVHHTAAALHWTFCCNHTDLQRATCLLQEKQRSLFQKELEVADRCHAVPAALHFTLFMCPRSESLQNALTVH